MRFKQFIIEQLNETRFNDNFAIKKLSDEQWAAWVEKNCSDYLPRASKHPIYRGFSVEAMPIKLALGVKDTNEFTRRSANTYNYFTLWLDNAAQWKDYPKRSKSFVGSSNFYKARIYGKLYQLFPANDAKIGICPYRDIWVSFNDILGNDVNDLNGLLQATFITMFGRETANRAETDWSKLRSLLKTITPGELIEAVGDNIRLFNVPEQFTRYPTLFDYFENEIVPEKHDFKHAAPATYSVAGTEDKEVWVQGKVALLSVDSVFDNDSSHLFPRTTALLSQYNIENPY